MSYPTIFPWFCEPQTRGCTATQACTVTQALHCITACGASTFAFKFFKLFTNMQSEAGHETCSSSWSCDRNLNLHHTNGFFFLLLNFGYLCRLWFRRCTVALRRRRNDSRVQNLGILGTGIGQDRN